MSHPTPPKYPLPFKIGPYAIQGLIASGGMGEIYLAQDEICARKVALKRIRQDLLQYPTLKERFLREAKIASQLTHPSIIPIYSIHQEQEELYYTMPYVEGETLKQIIKTSYEQEKKGRIEHPIGSSLTALMRIYFNVCQAIAYSHSKGILHRDLKPDNIIIGKYGEVLILDWGLAEYINQPSLDKEISVPPSVEFVDLTRPGKIPGTLPYIPPERIFGESASYSTDIYALGVILYQLLTLRLPFLRKSDKKIKKQILKEQLIDPTERAPYRDIPLELANVAKKCLAPKSSLRYSSVSALLNDLDNYIQGRGHWIFSASIDMARKTDWEFQENVLLAKYIAITQKTDVMEWVTLMIGKKSFPGTMKIEATVCLGPQSQGIGFWLNIPEKEERKGLLEDGYCLWIGSSQNKGCFLSRSKVEILSNPDVFLQKNTSYRICIERMGNHLRFYIGDKLILDYLTHIPQMGPHFGLLLRDDDLVIDTFSVFVSTQNIMLNCLAIPDAFLASNLYAKALTEYRNIATSFPGRAEGREAIFRAGITLLEEALNEKRKAKKEQLLSQSLDEFSKLKSTPGAPLEYLGKSLVYKATADVEEEAKCLELALYKYAQHPLLPILHEEIIFRLHEASYRDRRATYYFALMALRHLPSAFQKEDNSKLIKSLKSHWEPLYFIEELSQSESEKEKLLDLCVPLAFWLAKPYALVDILKQANSSIVQANALFCLIQLHCYPMAESELHLLSLDKERYSAFEVFFTSLAAKQNPIFHLIEKKTSLSFAELRLVLFWLKEEIYAKKSSSLLSYFSLLYPLVKQKECILLLKIAHVQALLFANDLAQAQSLLKTIDQSDPSMLDTSFEFIQGCIMAATSGLSDAIKHFEELSTPSLSLFTELLKSDFKKKMAKEQSQLFYWEKIRLLKQMVLFCHCAKLPYESKKWQRQLTKEKDRVHTSYLHS